MLFRKKVYIPSSSPGKEVFRRLCRNKLTLAAIAILILASLISVLGYLITPDKTPYANEQYIEISAQKPLFRANMLKYRKNEELHSQSFFRTMIFGRRDQYKYIPFNSYEFEGDEIVLYEFDPFPGEIQRDHHFRIADVIFSVEPDSFYKAEGDSVWVQPRGQVVVAYSITDLRHVVVDKHITSKRFLLGSDRYGRDVLSQLMIGTRISLSVGMISVLISLVAGIFLGALGGYFRGWLDVFVVWLINVVWSIPALLLVIAITFALGKGFWQVFVAVGLTMWVEVARVVRGQILSVREKEYIKAARALGFGHTRIILRHILPNVLGPVIVISAANFASAILIEAGLSFLGLGVQPPMPSWGTMIKENYAYIIVDKAYLAIFPGAAIMIMVWAFMILGNGLRDALDVKTIEKPGTL